jgi:hypothetical protein
MAVPKLTPANLAHVLERLRRARLFAVYAFARDAEDRKMELPDLREIADLQSTITAIEAVISSGKSEYTFDEMERDLQDYLNDRAGGLTGRS